ncbi:MAG: hypothetical protein EAZ55_03655 [Cytophagales bacterium]|nr:MAG: hypothetical protein EAZ55_03655 [Cytophagales bacterium]
MKYTWALCIFFTSFYLSTKAQNLKKIDSLQNVYHNNNNKDTTRILALIDIAFQYHTFKPDTTILLANEALEKAEKINFKKGQAWALNRIGVGYYLRGNYAQAIQYYEQCLPLHKQNNDFKGIASTLNGLAIIYRNQGNEIKALEYHQEVIKIQEKIKDKRGLATSLTNIGVIYKNQQNYATALEYYQKGLSIYKEALDKKGISNTLSDIGVIHRLQKKYESSLKYFQEALEIATQNQDKQGISSTLNEIARLYVEREDWQTAQQNYEKALKIAQSISYRLGIITALNGLANISIQKQDYQQSITYAEEALQIAQKLNIPVEINEAALLLYKAYKQQKNYEKALLYFEIHKQTNDTLSSIEKSKALTKLETKAIIERKDLQIKQQAYWNYWISAGLLIAIFFLFFIWRLSRKEREAKNLLSHQKNEIENTLTIIEQQNDDILASINYARRIQTALLPPKETLQKIFPELLLYYQPKDIVSGDFYWFAHLPNQEIIIAIADCTGHGVPGAFMTVVGQNLLEQIINKDQIYAPAQILTELDKRLLQTLQQQGLESKKLNDGMDIALLKINLNTQKLTFAGAKRPLWLFNAQNTTPQEYKGDKFPIGSHQFHQKIFTQQEITLQKNDLLYVFTDGYADQFGKEGKLTIRHFRTILEEIHPHELQKQQQILEEKYQHWKAEEEQTDDILILAIRI